MQKSLRITSNEKNTSKQGWRKINGKEYYFRSNWEYNYALFLEFMKGQKEIKKWEYEPETFWFEKIKRGVRSYKPDFKITKKDGRIEYHEVKGYMDRKSKTKLNRMRIYHPDVTVRVIDHRWFKMNRVSLAGLLGWE